MAQRSELAETRYADVRVGPAGRIVIPAELRRQLGIQPGDYMSARVEDGVLLLETQQAILDRIHAIMRRHVPPGVSLVDELIAERHAAAERELRELGE